jgi:molybdopterin-guanine dinucleotide biosynthesis protein A
VVKHDAHGIDIDQPGKDSDRFFRAGADVALRGPGESVLRRSIDEESADLARTLASLASAYDIVLVEGHKGIDLPKIWLHRKGESHPPGEVSNVLMESSFGDGRAAAVFPFVLQWLRERHAEEPVFGCILIGGRSSRMGAPKHLIEENGVTWLERTADILRPAVREVVVSGAGRLPDRLAGITQLADAPGARGPFAGILSAMRWNPYASWIVAACDMPGITRESIAWLLAQRRPGTWAVMPASGKGGDLVETLLAWYGFRSRAQFEDLAREKDYALYRIAGHPRTVSPRPPRELADAWKNVNTAGDIPRSD